jgi:hypothetical protein
MVERSAMTRAIAVVPSAPRSNLVAVPRESAAKCRRRAARSSPSTIVASSSSPPGSPNHQSAIKLRMLSAAAAITKERVSARPRCAPPLVGGGGGPGGSAKYACPSTLCVSSGDRFGAPLPGAGGAERVMLLMVCGKGWGGGSVLLALGSCGDVGKSAPCGLYASRVQMRSGRQIARRTGMTSVKHAVRRRNIPGAMIVLWWEGFTTVASRLCGGGGG